MIVMLAFLNSFLSVLSWVGLALFVIFFFSLCIVVHEGGHLIAAIWRGLYVERFSIGFGKRLFGFRRRGIDFWVSALPFGGYVAVPQLEPAEEPRASDGRPLPHARPFDVIVTCLAGPLGNIIFGFLLAAVVWRLGVYRPPPTRALDVIEVPRNCPEYHAGLRPGDRLIAVNGKGFTRGWDEVTERIVLSSGPVRLTVLRHGKRLDIEYQPAPNPDVDGIGYPFFKVREPTIITKVFPNSPADLAGFRAGDVVLEVNGKPVENPGAFIRAVAESGGRPLAIVVEREGRRVAIPDVRPRKEVDDSGKVVYRIGVGMEAPWVLVHPTPWEQFTRVFRQTRRVLTLLFRRTSLVRPRHLAGPVGIAETIAVKVALGGLREGLAFVVFVSFGLALVNLLPIPVLDGGRIVFALVELLLRRRIPVRAAYWIQTGFAVALIVMMLYITYYDVRRTKRIFRLLRPSGGSQTEAAASVESPAGESP